MIKIDLKNMTAPKLQNGLTQEDLNSLSEKLQEISEKFNNDKSNFGFTKLPSAYESLKVELEKADKLAEGMGSIVVIGIGGSDLGTRAIFRALKSQYHNMVAGSSRKLFFAGDTTDPESLAELLEVLDLSKTLFFIVSKSGNTV